MKILFISRSLGGREEGGVTVAKRNLRLLEIIAGADNVDRVEIPVPGMLRRIKNYLFGQSYGANKHSDDIFSDLTPGDYDFAFFDGSLYGGYVLKCAKRGIPALVFYHNVEAAYYSEKAKVTGSRLDRMMIGYVKKNEKRSTVNAAGRIVLNERDAVGLEVAYGKKADLILPTSFPSVADLRARYSQAFGYRDEPYCLFVGSDFFANVEGAEWFIDNVLPHIKVPLKIVGSVCNSLRGKYSTAQYPTLELAGFVEEIEREYVNASFVVLPILSGSGLKTKSVEALRYGKTVLGTTEAFEGITGDARGIGALCNTAREFIDHINGQDTDRLFNPASLELFDTAFSEENAHKKLKGYLDGLMKNKK